MISNTICSSANPKATAEFLTESASAKEKEAKVRRRKDWEHDYTAIDNLLSSAD